MGGVIETSVTWDRGGRREVFRVPGLVQGVFTGGVFPSLTWPMGGALLVSASLNEQVGAQKQQLTCVRLLGQEVSTQQSSPHGSMEVHIPSHSVMEQ